MNINTEREHYWAETNLVSRSDSQILSFIKKVNNILELLFQINS